MSEEKKSKDQLKKELEAQQLAEAKHFTAFYVRLAPEVCPPVTGVGVHGYVCNTVVAKRGYGLKSLKTTPTGYRAAADVEQTCVLGLIDVRLHKQGPQNETTMYLKGICTYLEEILKDEQIDKFLHVCYVAHFQQIKTLLENGIDYLLKHDMKNKQGIEVPYGREVHRFKEALTKLQDKGIEFKVVLEPGTDNPGAVVATENAMTALTHGLKSLWIPSGSDVDLSPPERYWNYSPTRHPFFNKSREIFVTNHPNTGGEFHYLLDFEQVSKKKDELHKREIEIGQRLPSAALCVARMRNPDLVIRSVIAEHERNTPHTERRMAVLFLKNLYSPSVHRIVDRTLGKYLRPSGRVLNLVAPNGEPVTHELQPPRQAMRLLVDMAQLEAILVRAMDMQFDGVGTFEVPGYGEVTIKDVTDRFYNQITDEKGKVTVKLDKGLEIPNTTILLQSEYPKLKDPKDKQLIDVTIGIDTPIRNAMAAMAAPDTKVLFTTAIVSERLIAYQTIFVYGGDCAIFSGHYSRYVYSL